MVAVTRWVYLAAPGLKPENHNVCGGRVDKPGLLRYTHHMCRICSIPDCGVKVRNRGYCNKHYLRFMRHGDPLFQLRKSPGTATDEDKKRWRKLEYERHKESYKARAKRWREENPDSYERRKVEYFSREDVKESARIRARAWAAKNKERKSVADKAWRESNAEHVKKYKSEWYLSNKERKYLIDKAWRESNFEKYSAARKEYRVKNKEKIAETYKKWAKENPTILRKNSARRRAAVRQALPPWLTKEHFDQIKAVYDEADRLTEETGIIHHVDHIVPLRGKIVSGLHVPWNLRAIPAEENIKRPRIWDHNTQI